MWYENECYLTSLVVHTADIWVGLEWIHSDRDLRIYHHIATEKTNKKTSSFHDTCHVNSSTRGFISSKPRRFACILWAMLCHRGVKPKWRKGCLLISTADTVALWMNQDLDINLPYTKQVVFKWLGDMIWEYRAVIKYAEYICIYTHIYYTTSFYRQMEESVKSSVLNDQNGISQPFLEWNTTTIFKHCSY